MTISVHNLIFSTLTKPKTKMTDQK